MNMVHPSPGEFFIMQQQMAAHAAWLHEQEWRAAEKTRLRAAGVTCDAGPKIWRPGAAGRCGADAAGRCAVCGDAFCESHRGNNMRDQCLACVERQAEQVTLEHEARAEAARREEAEHAERVARHEAASGWAQSRASVEQLDGLIAKTPRYRDSSSFRAFTWLAMAILGIAGWVKGDSFTVGATLAGCLGVLCWAGWALRAKVESDNLRSWGAQRARLLRQRGCGDGACSRCLSTR